jgi:rhodanese-related sulfurtransferase
MTASEIRSLLTGSDHPPVINVLDEKQYEENRIPGTINIPLESDGFVGKVEDRVDGKDKRVVVYRASADCDASPRAAKKLEDAGFTSVIDFDGGVKEWAEAGYQLEGTKADQLAGSTP